MQAKEENWDLVIKSKANIFGINFKELWGYRDLLVLLVKRDLVATYKQTLLGPLWFFIQPIFTTIVYYFMFGRIASISTDGKPALLFYMGGLVFWNYFAECVNGTSAVFIVNTSLFSKVYFPRLIAPLSTIISAGLKFVTQFALFLLIWGYYVIIQDTPGIHMTWHVLLLPVLILITSLLGLSIGIIVSAMTTKYRDLRNLLGYALQFGLYATPIIFPLSWLKEKLPLFYKVCAINPMTSLVETFKFSFFGSGTFDVGMLAYSAGFTLVLLTISLLLFHKVERTFVDTV